MVRVQWSAGAAYDAYVGRWSRQVAARFLPGLAVASGRRWLDVGCGTGALTATVLARAHPARVVGVDPSHGFVTTARGAVPDRRAVFCAGDARALPLEDRSVDAVVSGLVLNFVGDPGQAVTEVARVTVSGGTAAAYVWDYADGMAMMRHFWDAAATLDPGSAEADEGRRFSVCHPDALRALWTEAGFTGVAVRAIVIPTVFADFDDYWRPFLGGQGAAPGYAMSLSEARRRALEDLLRERLPAGPDGSIPLTARAWAVSGTKRH